MKNTIILFLLIFLGTANNIYSQPVVIPNFKGEYTEYVKKLEAGDLDIDFQDFRFSFIESEQFLVAQKQTSKLDSLKTEMYTLMDKSKYNDIIRVTKEMLSIDYTNILAHKILRQTYQIIGDEEAAKKYKTIQFGLLKSIIGNKNGLSCEQAWTVIQISEEYFILEMLDAKLKQQSISYNEGVCDKMIVDVEGTEKIYFFEVSKVFEGRKKLGLN